MTSALIYFIGFTNAVGGSEPLPLLLAKSLQEDFGATVTLALSFESDVEAACKQYGIELDLANLKIVVLTGGNLFRRMLGRVLGCRSALELRRIGPRYDICISCHGPRDFGRPSHHFIHMLWSFDRNYAIELGYARKERIFSHAWFKSMARSILMRVIPGGPRNGVMVLKDSREVCYPNSLFVKEALEKRYGCQIGEVFYPPTLFEVGDVHAPRDMNVAYIGRIAPEKHLDEMVEIIECVRKSTGRNVELFLAGSTVNNEYAQAFMRMLQDVPWVHFVGQVLGEEKWCFLAAHSFAVHTLKEEAFGISVTEYLKAGIVPVVPKNSGCAEIVGDQELMYETKEQCADIISRMIADPVYYQARLQVCSRNARRFTANAYFKRQDELIRRILEEKC